MTETRIPRIPDDIAESTRRLLDILDVPGLSQETKSALNTVRCLLDDQEGLVAIEHLDLTVRAYNVLKRQGINNVRDLAGLTTYDLLDMRNIGVKSYDDMIGRLTAWIHENGPVAHEEPELTPTTGPGNACVGCYCEHRARVVGQ